MVASASIHDDWHRQLRVAVASGVLTEPLVPLPATVSRVGTNADLAQVQGHP